MVSKRMLAVLLSTVIGAVSLLSQPAPKPSRTPVRAGHMLDVRTGKLRDSQPLVVMGNTIQSIAPSAQLPAQPGDTVVDLGGLTVLPGLIDVHIHLTRSEERRLDKESSARG